MASSTKPQLQLLKTNIAYHSVPSALFAQLCGTRTETLLLESSEINTKLCLKSLLIVDSALRITALDNQVIIEALTENGNSLLPLLEKSLPSNVTICVDNDIRYLSFPAVQSDIDEDSKLTASSIFDVLRNILKIVDLPENEPNAIFLAGLFSYDLVNYFENIPQISVEQKCPDFCFYLAETLLVIDHQNQTTKLQCSLFAPNSNEFTRLQRRLITIKKQLATVNDKKRDFDNYSDSVLKNDYYKSTQTDDCFADTVKQLQQAILRGDVFQVVASRRFSLPCDNPLVAYENLQQNNPSPYLFFMQDRQFTLFGSSPESALKFTPEQRTIEIYPIAGTRPRGRRNDNTIDPDLDSKLELEMRTDSKEIAEHLMLVDLARNDLARICNPGSRYMVDLMKVDRYSIVMHLVSRIIGTLRDDLDALHAYQACMNMGTLTGAPKVRAMQLIAETEGTYRGSYGGAIGYLNGLGALDTCIIIRSAFVQDGLATVQAGAGVVLDSDPMAEADETRNKAKAVLQAIYQAQLSMEVAHG